MGSRPNLLIVAAVIGCSDGRIDDAGTDAGTELSAWEIAFDATELGWLLDVCGAGDDLYAVGGSPVDGLILRFDGKAWSRVEVGFTHPLINWCHAFGSSDVTFVGAGGTVIHFDGARFERADASTTEDLWGVWGAAPNDLWAVGGRGLAPDQATIVRFDGTAWAATATPALERAGVFAYYKVWGSGSNDVYAVGQKGALIHWDGAAWNEIATEATDDLVTIFGNARDRIMAVGGRDNGQLVAFDGTTWRHRSLAPLPGLNGAWARNRDRFHVVGAQGTTATIDFATLTFAEKETDTFLTLHGLFGSEAGTLFAVGGSLLDIRPPHVGVALSRSLSADE